MKKSALRKLYLEKRLQLTFSEQIDFNRKIIDRLKKMDWHAYDAVHVFLPITKWKEIDTFIFIDFLIKNYPDIKIVVPKIDFDTKQIHSIVFDGNKLVLKINKYGILEPIHGQVFENKKIDMVLVPLLVFDQKGNRVGYGKGFYDRFLTHCHPNVLKIGLSFFNPIDKIDDTNELDIKMNQCICPEKTWFFK